MQYHKIPSWAKLKPKPKRGSQSSPVARSPAVKDMLEKARKGRLKNEIARAKRARKRAEKRTAQSGELHQKWLETRKQIEAKLKQSVPKEAPRTFMGSLTPSTPDD